MRIIKYTFIFIVGFLVAKFWYQKEVKTYKSEELQVVVNSIKNMRKLIVSKGTFFEVYNYSDSKKYFYEYLSFDKKAIITVNATVEVGYNLEELEIEIDSLQKKIFIHKIPKEEFTIFPNVKYFDLQQSSFNSFSKEELNEINEKSIQKIKETIEITTLKKKAKARLIEELSEIYQLSRIYNWQVVDKTDSGFFTEFKD